MNVIKGNLLFNLKELYLIEHPTKFSKSYLFEHILVVLKLFSVSFFEKLKIKLPVPNFVLGGSKCICKTFT